MNSYFSQTENFNEMVFDNRNLLNIQILNKKDEQREKPVDPSPKNMPPNGLAPSSVFETVNRNKSTLKCFVHNH